MHTGHRPVPLACTCTPDSRAETSSKGLRARKERTRKEVRKSAEPEEGNMHNNPTIPPAQPSSIPLSPLYPPMSDAACIPRSADPETPVLEKSVALIPPLDPAGWACTRGGTAREGDRNGAERPQETGRAVQEAVRSDSR